MPTETFLSFTNIQWAGLSSLATVIGAIVTTIALIYALGSPGRERKNKLKNTLDFFTGEIIQNADLIREAIYSKLLNSDLENNRDEIIKLINTMNKIETTFWTNNYQMLAELSFMQFVALRHINEQLDNIKKNAKKMQIEGITPESTKLFLEDIEFCDHLLKLRKIY